MPTKREGGLASLEHKLPPQESGHEDTGALEQSLKSDQDETAEEKANRLFNELNAELRKKRSEAKKNGQSEEEIKLIKFDKQSPLYNEWMKAVSKNELDYLDKDLSEIRSKIDNFDEKGERVPDELVNQLQKKARRKSEIEKANIKREEILSSVNNLKKKADKTEQSAKVLGKEDDLVIVEELAMIDGQIGVDEAELSILNVIALGEDSESVELPPPIPTDEKELEYFEKLGKFLVGEKTEKPDQKKEVVLGKSRGADKIKDVFYHYLEDDAKNNIRSREHLFVNKLNEIVGDDERFADLLLNDENFKNSVSNFFKAKIGVFAFGVEKKAAQFVKTLELARSMYDKILINLESETVNFDNTETEKEVFAQEPSVKKDVSKLTLFEEMDQLKTRNLVPEKLKLRVDGFMSEMDVQQRNLEILQNELKNVTLKNPLNWFNPRALNKRSELQNKIKETQEQIGVIKEALIDLGETAIEDASKIPEAVMTKINADFVVALNKFKENKVGSRELVDKATEVSGWLLVLATAAITLSEFGQYKEAEPKEKTAAVKMDGGEENITPTYKANAEKLDVSGMSYSPETKVEITAAQDVSVEPAAFPRGMSSEGSRIEPGFTSAGELKPSEEINKFQESKPTSKSAESRRSAEKRVNKIRQNKDKFADYDVHVAKLEKEISDLIQKGLEGAEKPVLDIADLTSKDIKNINKDPNSALNIQKQLEAKRAELKAYSEAFHSRNIKKEFKMAPVKAESLDFSGVKKLAVLSELADNETLMSGIITDYYKDGLFDAHNTLKTILKASQDEKDPKELKLYITGLNEALRFYKSLDTVHHPVNPTTNKQFETGKKSAELMISLIQRAIREDSAPDFGGIGINKSK